MSASKSLVFALQLALTAPAVWLAGQVAILRTHGLISLHEEGAWFPVLHGFNGHLWLWASARDATWLVAVAAVVLLATTIAAALEIRNLTSSPGASSAALLLLLCLLGLEAVFGYNLLAARSSSEPLDWRLFTVIVLVFTGLAGLILLVERHPPKPDRRVLIVVGALLVVASSLVPLRWVAFRAPFAGAAEFEQSRQAPGPTLAFFTASWCMPCHRLAPLLAVEAQKLRLPVIQVDRDREPNLCQRLAVRGIPAIVVLSDGREQGRLEGYRPEDQLRLELASILDHRVRPP